MPISIPGYQERNDCEVEVERDIPCSLSDLDRSVTDLLGLVERLYERMSPIMRDKMQNVPESGLNPRAKCKIANSIDESIAGIEAAKATIWTIFDQAQI